jgi:hypothetical protein
MRLQVVRIADRGLPNRERVHLSVLQETNLSYYAVLLSRYISPAGVANGNLAAFWFPNQAVRPGDQVVLFSGPGTPSNRIETNGSTTYFFYWGLPNTVWNVPANCAVVIEASSWGTSPQGG